MLPACKPGDEAFVDFRAYRQRLPQPDEIVIAQHPAQQEELIIKRVASIAEDGACFLVGDNPLESSDSFVFGAVPAHLILGQVTSLLPAIP